MRSVTLSAMSISRPSIFAACLMMLAISLASAQQTQLSASPAGATAPEAKPDNITLEDAITRAKANEPTFAMAVAADRVAGLDHSLARATLASKCDLSQPISLHAAGARS